MNVNYNENIINDGENDGVKLNSTQTKIIKALKENPFCTIEDLTTIVGVKNRAVERNLKSLKEKGLLERQGSDRTGSWMVKY